MYEYRLKTMPPELRKTLCEKLSIVEEKFKNKKTWLLYSEKSLDSLFKSHAIEFEKQNISKTGWDQKWKDYLQDGWLTDNVYFAFEEKTFDDGRDVIIINPAMAFGTGTHATTQIAARLMESVVKKQKVLDIGTGSGILAILASIKGASSVYAYDNDSCAIANAKENIILNKCENIMVWTGDIQSVSVTLKPTVVVANIITSVLQPLHPYILTLTPKYIIYSGITQKEGASFIASLSMNGYEPDEILHIGEWSGIRIKRMS